MKLGDALTDKAPEIETDAAWAALAEFLNAIDDAMGDFAKVPLAMDLRDRTPGEEAQRAAYLKLRAAMGRFVADLGLCVCDHFETPIELRERAEIARRDPARVLRYVLWAIDHDAYSLRNGLGRVHTWLDGFNPPTLHNVLADMRRHPEWENE